MKKTVNNLAEEYVRKKSYEDLTWTEEMHIEDAFKAGFAASKKIVLDMLNEVRSKASEEQIPKLGRTPNFEKELSYKASIKVLEKLLNKLG